MLGVREDVYSHDNAFLKQFVQSMPFYRTGPSYPLRLLIFFKAFSTVSE